MVRLTDEHRREIEKLADWLDNVEPEPPFDLGVVTEALDRILGIAKPRNYERDVCLTVEVQMLIDNSLGKNAAYTEVAGRHDLDANHVGGIYRRYCSDPLVADMMKLIKRGSQKQT